MPSLPIARSCAWAQQLVGDQLAWVMGGAQIYEASIPLLDGIVVTDIDITVEGADAFAPPLPVTGWDIVSADPDRGWRTAKNGMKYRFTALSRRGSSPWETDPLSE